MISRLYPMRVAKNSLCNNLSRDDVIQIYTASESGWSTRRITCVLHTGDTRPEWVVAGLADFPFNSITMRPTAMIL
jgi:hypothetical protein